MKKIFLIVILAVVCMSTTRAQTPGVVISDKPGWHKIAERHAAYTTDRDEIMVMGNNHFKQIKLKVKDNSANISSMVLYFGDGSKKSIDINRVLNAGEETEATDIDAYQGLQKVILVYNTVGSPQKNVTIQDSKGETEHERETEKERAEIEIWGMK